MQQLFNLAVDPKELTNLAGAAGYEPTLTRDADSVLMIYSADEGRPLARVELRCQPVFDGMAAAGGRLFLSLKSGELACFGE